VTALRDDLPQGTVTLLFTDIEGSTRLLHELGDAYADVLAEHRRVLREAFGRHGGVEVDTQGDAFFYAFARAADAVAAATDAQAALSRGRVRVRIGVHTGEPLLTDEGYVGVDVHRAARVMSAGHGGQVLVSEATRRLVDARFEFRDLGPQRLKDMTEPQRLYQLGQHEFPPLKTLNQSNLPVAASPLIGRGEELRDLVDLVRGGSRVVTVTGAGGSGKTRLALQAAAELVDEFEDGVFWVPLAGVTDAALVLPAAGQALGVRHDLEAAVASKRTLLLFDNFEHLLDAAAPLARLLAAAPRLQALVTSRAALHIDGERQYPLDPLRDDDAVALFVDRARLVGSTVEADETVEAICARLDRLPLAIELAAARTALLSPTVLLERLERRLPLLIGRRRDAPERQRTLRATIDWSYGLLGDDAKQLLARVSVFATAFSLDAAERVTDADLDTIGALADLSLLKPVGERMLMLETIREYARERLAESGDPDGVRRRHAEYFLELAESANLAAESLGEQQFEIVMPVLDDARAALDWALQHDVELGLRLVVALEQLWVVGNLAEGAERTRAFVDRVDSPAARARGLRAVGSSLHPLGRYDEARRYYEESLALYRELGDSWGIAHLLMRLAHAAYDLGDTEGARRQAGESLELSRRHGHERNEAQVLTLLGEIAFDEGDTERGTELLLDSAARCARDGFPWWQAVNLSVLTDALLTRELPDRAVPPAQELLLVAIRIGDNLRKTYALAQLAHAAANLGQEERAGRMWGFVEAEQSRSPAPGWDHRESAHAAAVLATPAWERGRRAGQGFTLEQAVEEALAAP
jgi:predicted ATPase/class 3 adenylate cyclase